MDVTFDQNWFAPDGSFYYKTTGKTTVSVPAAFESYLPKSCRIQNKDGSFRKPNKQAPKEDFERYVPPQVKALGYTPPVSLKDHDLDRAGADALEAKKKV